MRLKLKHTAQCVVISNGAEFIEAWHRFEFPATSVRFKSTSKGLQHDPFRGGLISESVFNFHFGPIHGLRMPN